jgi:hypothetical protein
MPVVASPEAELSRLGFLSRCTEEFDIFELDFTLLVAKLILNLSGAFFPSLATDLVAEHIPSQSRPPRIVP